MGLLDGRVVIVTGAGRGLGRAHCLELARHGAHVVVNDLGVSVRGDAEGDGSPAGDVVAEIEASGGLAVADGTSVTDWAGMEALVTTTVERFGDLHAVVTNAGFLRDRTLVSMSEDDFDAVVAVHLKGTAALTKHACAYWKDRAKAGQAVSGRVVMTTSGAGLFGNVGQANYAAAKSGIAAMARVVALEMERYGVTANAISPIAATRMLATTGRGPADSGGWDPLDPANAAPVVAYLCSEQSGWLTGAVLRVDGSRVHRMDSWSIGAYHAASGGKALEVDELHTGLRRVFGVSPSGLGRV